MQINIDNYNIQLQFDDKKEIVKIQGYINDNVKDNVLTFMAASPPDKRTSFSGSGLPFPSAKFAFENTSNIGSVKLSSSNSFIIVMKVPNSYYVGLGSLLVPPTLYLSYNDGIKIKKANIKLCNYIPYRTLTYPNARQNSMFYKSFMTLPIRGQEEIIRSSEYPTNKNEYANFWGLRPPV